MDNLKDLDVTINPLTHDEVKELFKGKATPIKREDLEVILQNCRAGARPLTIVATTCLHNLRVKDKDGNPLPPEWRTGKGESAVWHVFKRATVNGFAQYNYEAAMNRALAAEGKEPDFKVGDRTWGDRREVEEKPRTCLIDHTPKTGPNAGKPTVYFDIFVRRSLGYEYFLKRAGDIWDGVTLDPASVHAFLPSRPEETIVVRNYTLGNVDRVVVDGKTYVVEGTDAHTAYQNSLAAA